MWRYAPLKLVCQPPINTKEEEEEEKCCCRVHDVELHDVDRSHTRRHRIIITWNTSLQEFREKRNLSEQLIIKHPCLSATSEPFDSQRCINYRITVKIQNMWNYYRYRRREICIVHLWVLLSAALWLTVTVTSLMGPPSRPNMVTSGSRMGGGGDQTRGWRWWMSDSSGGRKHY